MRFLDRILFVWLLMLAIPLQGFAATAMIFCTPSHHSTTNVVVGKVASATLEATEHAAHHHANGAHSSHHEDKSSAYASSNNSDDTTIKTNTPLKIEKHGDSKCSACAACCASSAIVCSTLVNPVATTGSEPIPFTLESFFSYVPEGSDPPPRPILA